MSIYDFVEVKPPIAIETFKPKISANKVDQELIFLAFNKLKSFLQNV